MAKDTSPQDLFRQALAVTTKAISADRDVEVGFGNEAGGDEAPENGVEARRVLVRARPQPRDLGPPPGVASGVDVDADEADEEAPRRPL